MDLREYYGEIRKTEAALLHKYGTVVYVTSVQNRSKNTTAGATHIATPYTAAKVIVDETHREATDEEIKAYFEHQENNRIETMRSEARKKKEVVVVMDRGGDVLPASSNDLVESAIQAYASGRKATAGASATATATVAPGKKTDDGDDD